MEIVKFDRWVRRVIKNKACDYSRKEGRYYSRNVSLNERGWNDRYFITEIYVDDYPVEIYDGELYESISKLNQKRKEIIFLHYFMGYTDEETGEIMSIPRTTVHYNRKQSLTELRKELGNVKPRNN